MEYRKLGKSGIRVPELCFGCGTFGGKNEFFDAWGATEDIAEARKIVNMCMETGREASSTPPTCTPRAAARPSSAAPSSTSNAGRRS